MAAQGTALTSYRVEVSGWDLSNSFFVERTELEWDDQSGKSATVRHPLQPGAILFVRLEDSKQQAAALPVAYRVENVAARNGSGIFCVRLEKLWPRKRHGES